MKRLCGHLVAICAVSLLFVDLTTISFAAEKTNYSGTYTVKQRKEPTTPDSPTIRVVQTDAAIEITRTQQGAKTTNRFPLDGSVGDYISPGGVPGKCKAQLKDKYLLLESIVTTHPQPNAPPVRLHTKERWQLSSNSKILTIKTEVDFPDFPSGIAAVALPNNPWTDTYERTSEP